MSKWCSQVMVIVMELRTMSHSWIGSICTYKTQQALPDQTKSHRRANATNIAIVHPPNPWSMFLITAMTCENPLGSSLLTRKITLGTDCLFWKEWVSFNRLYLGNAKSHRDATNGSLKALFDPETRFSFHKWYFSPGSGTFASKCTGRRMELVHYV